SVIVDNPFPTRLLPRIPLKEILGPDSVYRVRMLGSGRVAARSAQMIEILPVDEYRYGRRLWLDRDTGMLLRSVVFAPDGTVVEKLSFVEIELGASIADAELESDLENPSEVTRYRIGNTRHESLASSKGPLWLPETLPKGFQLASVGHGGSGDERYEHLLFSDGLSSFSIYIEFGGSSRIAEQVESRGAMHIYTGSIEGNMVTVVGEVPAPTVRLIGRHLRKLQIPIFRHLQ
ncbi:MAG: MucB/RseB C-terminal domain-containing protein, partial [Wenzhouxiangellaceae bacterium]